MWNLFILKSCPLIDQVVVAIVTNLKQNKKVNNFTYLL
jgi:hypothetical protein